MKTHRENSLILCIALAAVFVMVAHLHSHLSDQPSASAQPAIQGQPVQKQPAIQEPAQVANREMDGCLQAPPCSRLVKASVLDLIEHANRYDRRTVQVSGIPIMVKLRRTGCGSYHYFVLKDTEGRFISVTDYTDSSDALRRRGRITVVGYYRAELHQIDVCKQGGRSQ